MSPRFIEDRSVELRTLQGEVYGRGKVLAYFEVPSVFVEMEDGRKQAWRADLTQNVSDVERIAELEREIAELRERPPIIVSVSSPMSTDDAEMLRREVDRQLNRAATLR